MRPSLSKTAAAAMLCASLTCLNSCLNRNSKTVEPQQETIEEPSFSPGDVIPQRWVEQRGAQSFFTISPISDELFAIMDGKSYKEGCPVAREDLRYITALHKDIEGRTLLGEMVLNKSVAADVLEILQELYNASYPIEKMRLVDYYDADDAASMADNNSSAFNFRPRSHQSAISKHALGEAVDINPLYNPFVRTTDSGATIVEPAQSRQYLDRSAQFPYKIEREDLCCSLFRAHGFYWGGSWASRTKDFQHFER